MTPSATALLLLLLPLGGALLTALFLRRRGEAAAWLSVGVAGVLLLLGLGLIFSGERFDRSVEWLRFGEFSLSLGFLFDDLAALMLFVVVFVGFWIHLFSLGYMKGDPHKARFFGGLSLFMFAMIGMTLADDLIMLFIFWELVGLSSYLLINFYFHKPAAVAASKKAFIVNRIGDFGFLLGIIWAYWAFGSINLNEIAVIIGEKPETIATGIALLLFCGAVGKSGQIPLHVWLPDAMEGPTPVSALIHAATMVAAGIYLLCRVSVVMTTEAATVILWIGVATAVYAGFCAIAQRDIKKILAYSTISQLGFMVAAFGLGTRLALADGGSITLGMVTAGAAAAMFHLTTHAFFKALLFLGAGSIIHACHHEQDIFKMGGLARSTPLTFITFTIGVLALIGMPFLAGFFSKDAILYLAWQVSPVAFYLLVLGALLTAFYMSRLWAVAFFGAPRSDGAKHAHENGPVMVVPLIVLALFSIVAGYDALYPEAFAAVMAAIPHPSGADKTLIVGVSVAVLVVGVLSALLFYRPGAAEDALERKARPVHRFLAARLWFDDVYNWYVAKVQQRLALVLSYLELVFISGLLVRGLAGFSGLLGLGLRSLHTGNLNAYLYWILIGLVLLWGLTIGLASGS
ncbi:MAG: NADH-quinone oxidoreductase subunit L [Puniceicoccaceae bacterium]|nr:MAG: NADH-quinone oxidoreductase subunit L [Puniceicoccaceae bacterium]